MLRSKRDREALQEIHLKQAFQEFPHALSVFPPSLIVKQQLLSFFSVFSPFSMISELIPFLFPPRVILSPKMEADIQFMQEALAEARSAAEAGEVPIGAVLVHEGKILARSNNRTIRDCDPTAHAEMGVLREAARLLRNYRLADTTLYVTIEPCSMCAGAIIQARVPRLVYGADDPKGGAVRSCFEILSHPRLNHQVEVTGGVLAADCAAILQSFFAERR
jgi:tRNA(adenine34) deaminase